MTKTLVCRCEDVTLEELEGAIARGYEDIEELKRVTGFGTGPCQGKECQVTCALVLAARAKLAPGEIQPFTARSPLRPVPLGLLGARRSAASRALAPPHAPAPAPASPDARARAPEPASTPFSASLLRRRTRPGPPLPARAEVVIIGAGIIGLAVAYELAKRGQKDIVVIDRGYLAGGASGRNGGGVRMQWSNESNIRIMQDSIARCQSFAREHGINVWFRQGGYLFLARTEKERARLEKNVALQNRCGVPTRMLTPGEARAIVPELEVRELQGACYNPEDGIVFPWPFVWGYAESAQRLGARIHTRVRVTGFGRSGRRIEAVETEQGTLRAGHVVLAAGAWSPELARLAGVSLPNHPQRHEILSTEPLKPFLKPMVSAIGDGLYASQSMRGEIVCGITVPEPPMGTVEATLGSSMEFLHRLGGSITRLLPILGKVKVLRAWAGPYDETPDGNPILGPASIPGAEVEGLELCCGFGGHGFMMAPAMGVLLAERLASGKDHELFNRWRLSRFADGPTEREDFSIG
jgi:sarcosine oxidase subunit beta